MLKKISGLSRSLYILLAIIAGFVALGTVNVALVLVVLGLISGLAMPEDRMVRAAVLALVLPIIGTALATIPTIGAQLTAVTGNLQLAIAGALASAVAIMLYARVMDGVGGIMGGGAETKPAAATA